LSVNKERNDAPIPSTHMLNVTDFTALTHRLPVEGSKVIRSVEVVEGVTAQLEGPVRRGNETAERSIKIVGA